MTPLFKKLNFKNQKSIVVIDSPNSFDEELSAMKNEAIIIKKIQDVQETDFAIGFVKTQFQVDDFISQLNSKLIGDAVVWLCYPKTTSKNYKCDFNRDTGWTKLGEYNFEPVRQVAIDEDWSALRFRKVEYIKTITRKESYALTENAKERTTQKGK
jgi:hypothetical protein